MRAIYQRPTSKDMQPSIALVLTPGAVIEMPVSQAAGLLTSAVNHISANSTTSGGGFFVANNVELSFARVM